MSVPYPLSLSSCRLALYIVLPLLSFVAPIVRAEEPRPIIVLAMHGAPPHDFPESEMEELFSLHGRIAKADESLRDSLEQRYAWLDQRMRHWPRNSDNDQYYTGSQALARELEQVGGNPVIVSFNEYCFPSVEEGLDSAIVLGATEVWVVTPMMTPGGGHSESDIPNAIKVAQGSHPDIPMHYAWPFELTDIATFLAGQVNRHRQEAVGGTQVTR